ncbi:MAG TPA: 4-oxalomesaconate tautomerase [Ilumatobacter sp.]
MSPGVRCMIMRGGSSKGAYFLRDDLPADPGARDELLLRIMGSPDPRQIDGIGGAHPLTSKVAIVGPADGGRADLEYLFLQVGVDDRLVSDRQNCGNLLAGVAPFALARGLIAADDGEVAVRIHMLNTDSVATAHVPVSGGQLPATGAMAVSGVPGTAAAIRLDFDGIAGSSCGALLPTARPVDQVAGVACTLVDNGMPVVVLRADALGITGYESCAELEADAGLRRRLEQIRLAAGPLMNLADVSAGTVPKLALVAAPRDGGDLCTRSFIPHRCHDAIGVLAAVSVATAAVLPGTPAHEVFEPHAPGIIVLEHPTGTFEAAVEVRDVDGVAVVERAGIVRTARALMDGFVYPRGYR